MAGAEVCRNLIVGSGRVATHFMRYLKLKGVPCANWNRKEHGPDDLARKLERAANVVLLIKDSVIRDFREEHLCGFDGTVAHFSGALRAEGLESFHPLMTFGPEPYALDFYERIHFAVSSEEAFRTCFPELSNPVFAMAEGQKALYHALCVMSGNFPQILWKACGETFRELGVPREAVELYLRQNLDNFAANPTQSLTGPLARGDRETIQKNMEALPEDLKSLYRAFVDFYR